MLRCNQENRFRWILIAAAYFAITALLYRHTVHSKFIFDWNTWMLHYMGQDWGGLPAAYGDGAMRWGYHLSNMVLWKLFGFNASGWYLSFIVLHALNGLLLSLLLFKILFRFNQPRSFLIALTAGTLWLVSPYHSETIVWGATSLYLVSSAFVLTGLLLFMQYNSRGRVVHALLGFACFFVALFTHEGAVVFPILLLVLWSLTRDSTISRLKPSRFLLTFLLPMIVIICLYFVANKLRVGSWVGHYGEASHLNTDITLIVSNLSKYLLKLLYIPLFFSFPQRDALYAVLENSTVVWIQLIVWIALASFCIWKLFKGRSQWRLTPGLLILSVVALLPVINLYFMYYKDIEQDRYVYLPSAFFYAALVVGLIYALKRYAAVPLAVCFLLSLYFLNSHTRNWAESGRISNGLLYDFRWQGANRVFVLLTPDNVNGAYCMRSMPGSTLSEMLRVRKNIDMNDRLFEAYQWNVVAPHDSAHCYIVDSNTLKLDLIASGAWFWHNSFGASDLETEHFIAKLDPYQPSFTIAFKDKQPGDVFIYAVNDHWMEVKDF